MKARRDSMMGASVVQDRIASTMALRYALAGRFSHTSRAKGDAYVSEGRVTILTSSADQITANVRGTSDYTVTIARDRRGREIYSASCECPHFIDHVLPCKHIWATLQQADNAGLFGDPADPHPGAALELVEPALVRPPQPVRQPPRQPSRAEVFLSLLRPRPLPDAPVATTSRYAAGEILYILGPDPLTNELRLTTHWRKRKQNGEWRQPQPARFNAQEAELAPPADRAVLVPLVGAGTPSPYAFAGEELESASFPLTRTVADVVLPVAAATGRLFTRAADTNALVPLTLDERGPWNLVPQIDETGDGYRLTAFLSQGDARIDVTSIDEIYSDGRFIAEGRLGRIALTSPDQQRLLVALRMVGATEIPKTLASDLLVALAQLDVPAAALPPELRVEDVDVPPSPRLRLARRERWHTRRESFRADLLFDYAGLSITTDDPAVVYDAAAGRRIKRHLGVEAAARQRLFELGARETQGTWPIRDRQLTLDAGRLPKAVRALVAEGWHVEAEGKPWRTAGEVRLSVTSGIDWFDLNASVDFGETSASLTQIIAALRRGESFLTLGDGTVGMLPEDWLAKYGPLVAAAEDAGDGRMRYRAPQMALLDALLEAQAANATLSFDAGFERARHALADREHLQPRDAPKSFHGTLRDYQREALGWFEFLRRSGFGGCLADDMGLGKTVMVLALLDGLRAAVPRGKTARPSLIVVPRSLVPNWIAEAARFAPKLRVVDYSGAARASQRDALHGGADVVLATYGTLRKDVLHLKEIEFEYVILDEAQSIKNAATASAKAARLLQGRHRLALTGTPIENHLGELWSVFDFLNPGLLGGSSLFQRAATRATADPETLALVARGLRPFILRRTKQQVARELPARTEQTIYCELDPPARALYDGLRREFRDALLKRIAREGLAKSRMHVLEALLRLRQVACHPALVDRARPSSGSAKFDVLLPRLREVAEEGHKALVFSQFTSLLALLRDALDAEGLTYEYLDGKTRDRAARVDRFQTDPEVPLFLISLKAGGLGLNLTAAEYVFLLDPWWNPAVENQAIDRTHRIGQSREVFACRLIARDTVEEKVLQLQQSKRALADAVLSADAVGLRDLRHEDLELLLS
jgi:superfamily II DNA or RNA helicase